MRQSTIERRIRITGWIAVICTALACASFVGALTLLNPAAGLALTGFFLLGVAHLLWSIIAAVKANRGKGP